MTAPRAGSAGRLPLGRAAVLRARRELERVRSGRHTRAELCDALRGLGNALYFNGHVREALRAYRWGRRVAESAGLEEMAGRMALGICNCLWKMDKARKAFALASAVRSRLGRQGNRFWAAQLDNLIVALCSSLEWYDRALLASRRAAQVARRLGDPALHDGVLLNRAMVFAQTGTLGSAERLCRTVLRGFAERGDVLHHARCLNNLGLLAFRQGQWQSSLASMQGARDLLERNRVDIEVARVDLTLAEALVGLNLFAEGISRAESASDRFESSGLQEELHLARLVQARALAGLGEVENAESTLRAEAASLTRQGRAAGAIEVRLHLASLLNQLGRHSQAVPLLHGVAVDRAILPHQGVQAEIALGVALSGLGKHGPALDRLRRGLRLARGRNLRDAEHRARKEIAITLVGAGKRGTARRWIDAALDDAEASRSLFESEDLRIGFLSDKEELYRKAIELELTAGRNVERVFTLMEAGRARGLSDLVSGDIALASIWRGSSREARRYEALRGELLWLRQEIERGERQAEGRRVARYLRRRREVELAIAALYRDAQRRSRKDSASEGTSLRALQDRLPSDTALVEYYLLEDLCLALLVSRRAADLTEVPCPRESIEDLARELRLTVGSPAEARARGERPRGDDVGAILEELSARIGGPIARAAGSSRRLLIVPHGVLHGIPFAALPVNGKRLGFTHPLTFLPAARLLGTARHPRARRGASLVLGAGSPGLPWIVHEARTVAKLLPKARLLANGDATKDLLERLAPASGLLHLACHATVRGDNPMFSALELADGPLTALDLSRLEIGARHVTLSACHTAVGEIRPGDEVMAFYRAFLAAGARSFLGSLWGVGDEATCGLMVSLYESVRNGSPLSESLRRSMVSTARKHPSPYFWAPFILVGSPSTRI